MTHTPGTKITDHCDECNCDAPQTIVTWDVSTADFTARCHDCGAINEL